MTEPLHIEGEPLGKCPCGQDIFADEKQCMVIHTAPTCEPFLTLGTVEFLAYVRRSRGIGDN